MMIQNVKHSKSDTNRIWKLSTKVFMLVEVNIDSQKLPFKVEFLGGTWEDGFLCCITYSSSIQSFSLVQLFATPWTATTQASLSIINSQSLLKLMSIESVMPSICLILCQRLLLLASVFPSIKLFSNESVLWIRWPKYWSFSFNISPSNGYSGLISFRIGWFDLLSVQGTLKSLLQHHSSKASILQGLAFFMVQLSHP